ncbi:MAG: hypothetical protein ACRC6S_12170 [Shewanella sp.]
MLVDRQGHSDDLGHPDSFDDNAGYVGEDKMARMGEVWSGGVANNQRYVQTRREPQRDLDVCSANTN